MSRKRRPNSGEDERVEPAAEKKGGAKDSPRQAGQSTEQQSKTYDFGKEVANWLFPIYLAIILVGFEIIAKFGQAAGATPGTVRSLFIAINAATLTGFSSATTVADLNPLGQFTVFCLIITGSLFAMIAGGLAVVRIARIQIHDFQIVLTAVVLEFAAAIVGLFSFGPSTHQMGSAAFLGVSVFGNCGLSIGKPPDMASLLTHLLILPLTVIGGLGIPVILEMVRCVRKRNPLSEYSRTVLGMTGWMYVIGTIVLAGLCAAGHFSDHDPRWIAETASVLSVESRSGGLPIISPAQISHAAQWVLILLMAIGASPAGTGGGLKSTTISQLIAGVRKLLRGEAAGTAFPFAIVWLSVYVGLVLGSVILLSFVMPGGNSDNIFFNAVSGVSNVGFSLAEVPEQPNVLFAYCAIMLVGRMTPLLILWWMADVVKEPAIAVG